MLRRSVNNTSYRFLRLHGCAFVGPDNSSSDKYAPCHHGMAFIQVVDGGECLKIQKAAAISLYWISSSGQPTEGGSYTLGLCGGYLESLMLPLTAQSLGLETCGLKSRGSPQDRVAGCCENRNDSSAFMKCRISWPDQWLLGHILRRSLFHEVTMSAAVFRNESY